MTGQLRVAMRAMGRDPDVRAERLAGSASGSEVFRVWLESTQAVLKVTTVEQWRAPARHELRCYRELVDQLPVATPRLLEWVDTDEVTAMLLTAHSPAVPANEWTEAEWIDASAQLGALHAQADPAWLDNHGWLPPMLRRPPPESAVAYWRGVGIDHAPYDDLPAMADVISVLPECFMHGDCHADNFLRAADGTLIWSDWQGASLGHGAEELAFLWGRADTDGGKLPREAMLSTYASARGVEVEPVRLAVLGAELGCLLTAAPEYAYWNPPEARDRQTRRCEQLILDWRAVRETRVDP